jgi:hypothetical protein
MQTGLKSWVTLSILLSLLAGGGLVVAEEPAPEAPVPVAAAPEAVPVAAAAEAPVVPPAEVPVARPFDVLLVLDNSASMQRNDPQTLMRTVAKEFAQRLPADARLGVVLFDERAELALSLADSSVGEFLGQVDTALARLGYRGQRTNIPAGVERALYEMRMSGRAEAHRVIVLLTDGLVDVGSEARSIERTRWLRENLAAEAKQQGVRVFGIAFTEQADFELIQSVAQVTGGGYFRVLSAPDIAGVFEQVRGRLDEIARAEAAEAAARVAAAQPRVEKVVEKTVEKAVVVEKPVVVETEKRTHQTRVVHQKPIIVREPVVTPIHIPEPRIDWRVVLIAMGGLVVLGVVAVVALRSGRRTTTDPGMPAARLRTVTDRGKTKVYKLKKVVTRIGRARDNDIVLPYETVSAHHAVIEWRDGAFHLRDLGSTNGTQRNGIAFSDRERKDMRAVRLRHRDRIAFDRHAFEFMLAAAERVDETRIGGPVAAGGTVVHLDTVKNGRDEVAAAASAAQPDPADVTAAAPDDAVTRVKDLKCLIHEHSDATQICPVCGRAWCEWCLTEKNGTTMCRGCAEKAA